MKTCDARIKKKETTGERRPKTAAERLRPFVFLLGLLAVVLPAHALQISPTYQVLETDPGGTVSGRLKLLNNHGEDVEIKPSVREWVQTGENKKTPVDQWLKLDTELITLKNGESREIEFTATVPKKARGEMIGMLTFATKQNSHLKMEAQGGGAVTLQVSVAVYVAIKGTEQISQELDNLVVNITTNTEVTATIRNTGNCHTRPKGWIYIYDNDDRLVLNVELETGKPTYPELTRAFKGSVKGYVLPAGKYVAKLEMQDVDRAIKYPTESRRITVGENGKVTVR